ncbi:glucose dehydrogenase [bacterium (Candidatus Blackallbacteria) CG17_big_fil_post_rev_8_21_14_2_50_48_46]|uniref:Glucose dehydrogenase n=1 Tax=bacterium (Candidatus Blackallbacteria) CG17_big_fil_post_rev_8_21_14_2_50_48_46 TaxID=2014261 RepID=A0A2M7G3V9_9BACT|nr:MAG: glucose dehydrogenase [bacterium (Candidatus Blackallbacteria) CG18_big_fil_WC_8_21_14_2_50_49_26]PIW16562.1 MAG: glucose dehydrogenase [bacterium (Candidatus Blackallbacteria) CG17_big_fil_post_rev_8_21_14_2_50_48_46]PIW46070.1 MAG: glucose dehydrogenase [bacterium (Candidatus Blackallbacteria) CG13_big_fil_rev_8_21_14_2_50_49_14]
MLNIQALPLKSLSGLLLFLWSPSSAQALSLSLQPLPGKFKQPVFLTAPAGSDLLFVIEQQGMIWKIAKGQPKTLFLDLRRQIQAGGEKGLLSMAFAPDYLRHGRFFLNYTTGTPLKTRISEWRANPQKQTIIQGSERVLLEIPQPYQNHNGGQIAFGKDGMLYIGMGDGGSANDPHGNGQNPNSLLGKILRIDVSKGPGYRIPTDNPFQRQAGYRPEIWAYGLRNPWRFSFDRQTGELYLGDVGQNRFEEIDLVEKGQNYGWNRQEGFSCFSPPQNCSSKGLTAPLVAYGRQAGIAVTGGYVYRGKRFPALSGLYLYGDFGSGKVWGLKQKQKKILWHQPLLNSGLNISSFGEDGHGELYLLDYSKGRIYRIEAGSRK